MNLVIVESPTKSRTLQNFLGPKYRVLSSYGHIRDLPESEFGVDVEKDFKPKYVIPARCKRVIQFLKNGLKNSELVLLATDEDREGESIAWHLAQVLNLNGVKPYQRIVFHEITKQAIEEAIKNPRKIDMNLVDAQQARRILDRIVGYKLSPFLWKKIARGLSAGRVQSVAVRLVVDREREIENFKPQEYWSIEALLDKIQNPKSKIQNKSKIRNSKLKTEFAALLVKKNREVLDKFAIKDKKAADEILKDLDGAEYKVSSLEKKEVKHNPLPPFTTSTLQQEAFRKFHFPAKMTIQLAQQLYETGRITYHRTDSLNLSDLSLFAAKKFIINEYGKEYWAGFFRKFKTKSKGAQEAHEAIRPTFVDKKPEDLKLEKNQLKLYDLIWRRFIACQMAQASFDSTVVEIKAINHPKLKTLNSKQIQNSKFKIQNYIFKATGQILQFDGFLRVYPLKFEETELPPLEKEEVLKLIKLIPSQHFTQPPPRYTEATLIKALEENGIGRPSTYALILSTIQERNYIEKDEQKKIRPTEIGIVVNDLLVTHFPKIVNIKFTAEMEEDLDKIAQGKKQWVPVVREFYGPFAAMLEQKYKEISKKEFTEKATEKKCPECSSPIFIRLGKYGKFYACSNFPKCKYTESLEKIGETSLNIKCPKCGEGEITEKRTKKKKTFYGCNRYPACDFALWDKPTGEKCEKCGSLIIETAKKQTKCSNKECVKS